ncbi:metallo-beta-lactamase domain-containing protein 1 [Tribolium castaneum]|uniref:Metallo-beta-lactamase domain-containing protein 1 n=1 Tax=Tribolium castaneum TaxID=7070 RepID=D2A2I3_TRICA|nr:PREDICTED: metallo-beta-lactamase domain-containing protein 1 [Tribolium castaneum]EFA02021.1 Metallo-beta-lactamase domain-containing protein 1-like Protein [Tribolium castaneum]|eukprot:XP_968816.1 PREDICTED: metallo-beta-lactamase domain-containing protein 1 [Tribolium castaneum]
MEVGGNPRVIVLFDGYSKTGENFTLANCTCTLIKGPPHVIVDTMTAWDGEKIRKALAENHLNCDSIDFVVCTHGHSDHIGCNYLFPKAVHIVGFCISSGDKYFEHDFTSGQEYVVSDKVTVIPTPGHTMQDVSVIVRSCNGVVAITGDLFEKEEDLRDDRIWKSAGSDNEELQVKNRKKILEMADFVVPGHGPLFKIDKQEV